MKKHHGLIFVSKLLSITFLLSSLSNTFPVEAAARLGADAPVTEEWDTNKVLGQNGDYTFAGVYEYDNLTIGDNVTVFSSGISQLVIKVKGTLTLGKNAAIRVRNGAYKDSPANTISTLSDSTLSTTGVDAGGFRLFDKMYGKGGDGGIGGNGINSKYASSGGGGGGGGFGGGIGGTGGARGTGTSYTGSTGGKGGDNGGFGGSGLGGYGGYGGGATDIGEDGTNGSYGGNSGGGGGGNGGNGGIGASYNDGYNFLPAGGSGGGGGGYGGGILTIIADNISYDHLNPPKFLVSGQQGGKTNISYRGQNGMNGEGGLLIIQSPNYIPSASQWNLGTSTYGDSTGENGHGVVTGNPQKIFINEKQIDSSDVTAPAVTSTVPAQGAVNVPKSGDIVINFDENILKGFNFNYISINDSSSGTQVPCSCSIDGTKLTISHEDNLALNKNYTVTIPPGAIIDSVGNTSNDNYTFTFTSQAVDYDPPTVKLSSPAYGAVNVDTNTDINITYTENILEGSSFNNISIKNLRGDSIDIDKTITKNVLTLHPKAVLANNNTFTVTVPAGALKDESNNATTSNYSLKFSSTVKVSGISLSPSSMTLIAGGGSGQINAVVYPTAATDKKVTWTSSNPTAATVSDGIVTPLSSGDTVITAVTEDGGFTATCSVKINVPGPRDVIWKTDQVLGQNGDKAFASVNEFDSLYIGDNVNITNTGTSQMVIKVNGTLTLGKNSSIRVRNGYYADVPQSSISSLTSANLDLMGYNYADKGYTLYENMFGKGGDGGNGGNGGYGGAEIRFIGSGSYMYISGDGGSGGGGGAGGYGGGQGGKGGLGGGHQELANPDEIPGRDGINGSNASNNGGNGGNGGGGLGGTGGGATDLGAVGNNGGWQSIGIGGGGGGGNGAYGYSGDSRLIGSVNSGDGGGGGGAGGYGGGILTIIADKIVYDKLSPAKFIVNGQVAGAGGGCGSNANAGTAGQNGLGGLLIIKSKDYSPSAAQWDLSGTTFGQYDQPSTNGGHGIVTGQPQKVFINGVEVNSSDSTSPLVTVTDPVDSSTNVAVDKLINVDFSENIIKGQTGFDNISLINESTNLPVDCTVSISGNRLSIKPSLSLQYNTNYIVSIPSGAVSDYLGNPLTSKYNFSFTTVITPYGDFDNNGTINILDLSYLALHYGLKSGSSNWDSKCDIKKDNVIDIYDLVLMSKLMN